MEKEKNKINHFDQFIQYKSLDFKYSSSGAKLFDLIIEDSEQSEKLPLKNVCAKLHIDLVERLDNTINSLDISKRVFIEYAIIEALNRADEIMNEVDITEFLREQGEAMAAKKAKEVKK